MVPAHGGSNDVPPYPPFDFTLPLSQIVPQLSSPSELSSLSPSSASASRAFSSRRSSIEAVPKCCSHCEATTTPLWRRHPATHEPLCNACGLYLQQRHKMRPRVLIAAEQEEDELPLDEPGLGPECSHCHARKTSVWRRSKSGAKLCNACGVYARLRGRDRPLSLRRNKIRPRCKHSRT
ncbi:hypothetical protein B0H11DRAFT_1734356 [Mycena galericulata]|nr:hypothetical protein B0H11DRAFT_1734356 [Mycena galericulata]